MKVKEIFDSALGSILNINPSKKTFNLLEKIVKDLSEIDAIDSFFQLKKSERGEGLAFELMFLNEKHIYDLVCTRNTINLITILIKDINQIKIETNTPDPTIESTGTPTPDLLKMTILSYSSESLYYASDSKKLDDFNRIKNTILKLL